MEGVITSLRLLFALFRVNERYGDLSPVATGLPVHQRHQVISTGGDGSGVVLNEE